MRDTLGDADIYVSPTNKEEARTPALTEINHSIKEDITFANHRKKEVPHEGWLHHHHSLVTIILERDGSDLTQEDTDDYDLDTVNQLRRLIIAGALTISRYGEHKFPKEVHSLSRLTHHAQQTLAYLIRGLHDTIEFNFENYQSGTRIKIEDLTTYLIDQLGLASASKEIKRPDLTERLLANPSFFDPTNKKILALSHPANS